MHPIILWQLARRQHVRGVRLQPLRRSSRIRRRLRRLLDRPGRRQATDDVTVPPAAPAARAEPPAPPRLDVVVTTRTNVAKARCEAPNCAGHRDRA
jgi:hypothetical protein